MFDRSNAVATNGTAYVYLAGEYSQNEAFLAKCAANGTSLWNRTWGGSGIDKAYGVATDRSGNVYMTGETNSHTGGAYDAFLAKYDPSGTSLWNRTWGDGDTEQGFGIATDGSGNVFLSGYDLTGNNAFLAKYDPSGTSLWNRTWGGSQDDYGYGVATDGSGNAYLAGATRSYGAGANDAFLAKYDPSGTQLWNRTWGGGLSDEGYGVATDGSGNVYLAGATESFGAGLDDAFLAKFNSSGTSLWNQTWGGSSGDAARGVTADWRGNTFLVGYTDSFGAGQEDAFLAKFDPSGTSLWNCTWRGIYSETGRGVATDGTGNVYFACDDYYDPYLVKYTHIAPPITINTPSAGKGFHTAPQFNVTVADLEMNASWYAVGATGTNRSFTPGVLAQVNAADWAARPEGSVTLRFWANDTEGDLGYAEVTVTKDSILPSITINLPAPGQLFNTTAPAFSLAIMEANLDETWYSLDGGATNTTCGLTGSLSAQWEGRPNGTVTVKFWANDTAGHENSTSVTILKDTTLPSIAGTGLVTGQLCNATPPTFNLTIVGGDLGATWYSLDGGANNVSCACNQTVQIDAAQWIAHGNGTIIITFWANGTAGNVTSTSIAIEKDVLAPVFASTGLSAWQIFGVAAPAFSLSIMEGNLNTTWYSLDGGATNTTCGLTGSLSAQWGSYGNGTVTVTFWANDLVGNSTTTSILIWKDIIAPTMEISAPLADTASLDAPSFTMTCADINLDAVWYTLGNDPTSYIITGLNGKIDAGAWASQPAGQVTIHFWANDMGGNTISRDVVVVKLTWFEVNYLYVIAVGTAVGVISLVSWQRTKTQRARNHAQFQAHVQAMEEGTSKFLAQVESEMVSSPDFKTQVVSLKERFPIPELEGRDVTTLTHVSMLGEKLIMDKQLQGTVWNDIFFADTAVANLITQLSVETPALHLQDITDLLHGMDSPTISEICKKLIARKLLQGTVWNHIFFSDSAVVRLIKQLSQVYPTITLVDLSEKLSNIDRSILKQIVAHLVEQQKIRVKFDLHSEILTLQAKIDEAAIKKLNGIIRIDKRVDLNKAQEILSIPKEDVRNLIYEMAGEGHIEGQFDGDIFVIQSDIAGFINELNHQFQIWDKSIENKEKKV